MVEMGKDWKKGGRGSEASEINYLLCTCKLGQSACVLMVNWQKAKAIPFWTRTVQSVYRLQTVGGRGFLTYLRRAASKLFGASSGVEAASKTGANTLKLGNSHLSSRLFKQGETMSELQNLATGA